MNTFQGWTSPLGLVVHTTGVSGAPNVVPGPFPGVSCSVFNPGSTAVYATIFSAGGGALQNPFPVNSDGSFLFQGPLAAYDLLFSTTVPAVIAIPEKQVPSYATAALPPTTALLAGRLARLTDGAKDLVMDSGSAWVSVAGQIVNVKTFGATGDGVTDDSAAIAAAIAALPANGGVVDFPPGTYVTNNATQIISLVDANISVWLRGAGVKATTLKQLGTGNGIVATGTVELDNLTVSDMTVQGNNTGGIGIQVQNGKDTLIERFNISGWKNHAINVTGVQTVHTSVRHGRISAAAVALSTGRGVNARIGNSLYVEDCYFNIGGNPNTGGTGYDTAIDCRGSDTNNIIGNIYDGCQYAVQCDNATVCMNEYVDFASPAPVALSNGYYPQANNTLTIIGNRNTNLSQLVYNPLGVNDKYINLIGFNDGQHGGSISGTLVGAVINPAQIAANQNDYFPTGARYGLVWYLTSDTVGRTITGIGPNPAAGANVDGKHIRINNVGAYAIYFAHQNAGSLAGNRIITIEGDTTAIRPNCFIDLIYDATVSRWRVCTQQREQPYPSDVNSPASLGADQNDYKPAGTAVILTRNWRLTASVGVAITGIDWTAVMVAATALGGYRLTLTNLSVSTITLKNQNAGSQAANRIITGTGADIVMAQDQTYDLWYDAITNRWRVIQ